MSEHKGMSEMPNLDPLAEEIRWIIYSKIEEHRKIADHITYGEGMQFGSDLQLAITTAVRAFLIRHSKEPA